MSEASPNATTTQHDHASNGQGPAAERPVNPAIWSRLVAEYPGMPEEELWVLAGEVAPAVRSEHKKRMVRRFVDDDEAALTMRLDRARAVNATAFLAERVIPPTPCLGVLVAEGHNATLTAQYKTGKSTLLENAAKALVSATAFLGIFDVRQPYRVALINPEMTEDDCRARLQALGLAGDALERLLVLNLRGVGLSITAPAGRRWLTDQLAGHRTEVVLMDGFLAMAATSLESENDNAGGRRWLMTWDAIKADAGIHTSVIAHHTGRAQQNEGEEHGRGMTALDDWADVRLILTRDRESGRRFLASEGRSAYNLPESRLMFNETTRELTLPESAVGESRSHARESKDAELVVEVVRTTAALNTIDLRGKVRDAGLKKGERGSDAIATAKLRGLVHTHRGERNAQLHYLGAIHADTDPCPDTRYTREAT